jgi:hypothetical protein
MHICPVCGYQGLSRPPADHLICPSCGTQFGYNDAGPMPLPVANAKLRDRWIQNGAHWYSHAVAAPPFWSPWKQLWGAGFVSSIPYLRRMQVSETTTLTEVRLAIQGPPISPDTVAALEFAGI